MNAGSTVQSGHTVVTTATNGDLTYLIVVMGGQTIDGTIYSYVTASKLIDWAFASFNYIEVLSPNELRESVAKRANQVLTVYSKD